MRGVDWEGGESFEEGYMKACGFVIGSRRKLMVVASHGE